MADKRREDRFTWKPGDVTITMPKKTEKKKTATTKKTVKKSK